MKDVLHDEQPTYNDNDNDNDNVEEADENETAELRRGSRTRTATTQLTHETPGESTTTTTTQQETAYYQTTKDIKIEQLHNMTHEESFHDVAWAWIQNRIWTTLISMDYLSNDDSIDINYV